MRILIADDDAVSRRVLSGTLARLDYEVTAVSHGDAAWQALQRQDAPRLAVLDWMMPGKDGPEVCRAVRRQAGRPYVYLLLLTARDRKEDLIAGLEAGADDYLVKPFNAFELKARLDVGRRILDLQKQLIAAYEEMRHGALHDPLTGVCNRGAILEHFEKEWRRAEREQAPLGVLLADIDHFKAINDTHGHQAGDAVLWEVAQRMRAAIRASDAVGRYGGEEFLMVLPGCDTNACLTLAERLRKAVCGKAIMAEGNPVPVTLSLGVSSNQEPHATDLEALLRATDTALYRAKNLGRNRAETATAADVWERLSG